MSHFRHFCSVHIMSSNRTFMVFLRHSTRCYWISRALQPSTCKSKHTLILFCVLWHTFDRNISLTVYNKPVSDQVAGCIRSSVLLLVWSLWVMMLLCLRTAELTSHGHRVYFARLKPAHSHHDGILHSSNLFTSAVSPNKQKEHCVLDTSGRRWRRGGARVGTGKKGTARELVWDKRHHKWWWWADIWVIMVESSLVFVGKMIGRDGGWRGVTNWIHRSTPHSTYPNH